jgi:hypothetical protein
MTLNNYEAVLFLCELLCSNRFVIKLKLMEDPLQSQSYRFLTVVGLSGHLIDGLSQQVREVQYLESQKRLKSVSTVNQ